MNATETTSGPICIPYGPDHRREMEALVGVEFAPKRGLYGTDWHKLTIAQETICGITLVSYGLADGRVLVKRSDGYTSYSAFTFFADRRSWDRWYYIDRRRGEIDPETGRYRG